MRVNTMIRWAGLASAIALVAACTDAPTTAPAMSAAGSDVAYAKGGNNAGPVTESATITIDPNVGQTLYLGRFTLYMPAHALCANNSGYGRTYWDQSCDLAKTAVKLDVTWTTADNVTAISFSRDLRFNPAVKVYISVKTVGEARKTDAILWFDPDAKMWVDEGTYDNQMKTYRSNNNVIWRRLKHFSGYNVGAGENCDPLVDPTCGGGGGTELGLPGF